MVPVLAGDRCEPATCAQLNGSGSLGANARTLSVETDLSEELCAPFAVRSEPLQPDLP